MSGLKELVVSLTKNGYFKVAEVIKQHPSTEVLDNIHGVYPGINLDRPQILKMLSGDPHTEMLPSVWDDIRDYSDEAINALVFISVIFSHKTLIEAFSASMTSEMRGTLSRDFLGNKVYTNLVDSMKKAGLCSCSAGIGECSYNFAPLFSDMSIGPLAKQIVYKKLEQTKWKEPTENDHFVRTFYEQCYYYNFHKTLGISRKQFKEWLEGEQVEIEAPPEINYPTDEVTVSASLLAALATKPFVILGGTTGTGKTRTIRQLVERLSPSSTEKNFNHVFIPVEAGWSDARHLLGYRNPFGKDGENYSSTALLNLLLRANYYNSFSHVPFFVILDEMNLSYVEKYFSKFLSIMETTYDENSEPILTVNDLELMLKSTTSTFIEASYVESAIKAGGLFLTNNVFVVGTVNVDETTHMFSPKVLDRAFVQEFKSITPSSTGNDFEIDENDKLSGSITTLTDILVPTVEHQKDRQCDDFLDSVHRLLGKYQFGPRVTNECRGYVGVMKAVSSETECSDYFKNKENVLDRLMMQKILPKLHGNKGQLSEVIKELKEIAEKENLEQSSKKLESMGKELLFPGFTSYFS